MLLRAIAYVALAAPTLLAQNVLTVSPPEFLAGDLAVGLAGGVQQRGTIAAGSTSFLAIWEDHRAGLEIPLVMQGSHDLYARRIGADGTPIDALPFQLSDAPGRKQTVRAAFHGGVWLVTWHHEVETPTYKAAQLSGVRVAEDGTILDAVPLAVRSYPWSQSLTYALTSDANGWLVAVQGTSAGPEAVLDGVRVHPDGSVTDFAGPLMPGAGIWTHLALASNGSQVLLAGSSGGTLSMRRLDSSFAFLGSSTVVASGGFERPRIATDGQDFLLVYENQSSYTVHARRVTAAGVTGPALQINDPAQNAQLASVAWDGSAYVVASAAHTFSWPAGLAEDIRVARVGSDGLPIAVPGLTLGLGVQPREPWIAAIATGPAAGSAQIVWSDMTTPPHPGDILTNAVRADGFGPLSWLATSASRQAHPDVAAGGLGFLAVATSERGGSVSIVCQRLDDAGVALDAEPVELGAGPMATAPRVAWNGSSFLVVWQDGNGVLEQRVFARRVGVDGSPLDPAPFLVMDGGTPDVGAVGDTFLVAARRAVTSQIQRIYAVRVDGGGQVLQPEAWIGNNFARWPRVASMGDRWIVTWQRNPTHDNPNAGVVARVVHPDMSLESEMFLDSGTRPAIAAKQDRALMVFVSGGSIRGRFLSNTGAPLALSSVVGDGPGVESLPGAAWLGGAFLVAWQDTRNKLSFVDERRDVYAGRVTPAGVLLDGVAGVPLFAASSDDSQPALAATPGGPALAAVTRHATGAPYATLRVATASVGSWAAAGGAGTLRLVGGGTLAPGGPIGWTVLETVAGAPGVHVIGFSELALPFAGAALVPSPDVLLPFVADSDGRAAIVLPVGATPPPGITVWVQSWALDPAAPHGLAASDALRQSVP